MKLFLTFPLTLLVFAMTRSASAGEFHIEHGLDYANEDGTQLKMSLYLPDGDGTALRPGIVAIHGGAWFMGTRRQQWCFYREFARNGFVVMSIDYRLMPRHAFPECLEDCKSAVRWMRLNAEKYHIDPNRIDAFGASAGGHLAAFLATAQPEDGFEGKANPGASSEVKAVVSLYGAVDLPLFLEKPQPGFIPRLLDTTFKDFVMRNTGKPYAEALAVASPMTYARATSKPILFVHGTKDHLVQYEQSVRFNEKLKSLGVATDLVLVPGRGHGFDMIHHGDRKKVFVPMLEFLNKYG